MCIYIYIFVIWFGFRMILTNVEKVLSTCKIKLIPHVYIIVILLNYLL